MLKTEQHTLTRFMIASLLFPSIGLLLGPGSADYSGFLVVATLGFLFSAAFWTYRDPLEWHAPVALSAGGLVTVISGGIYEHVASPSTRMLQPTDDPSGYLLTLPNQVNTAAAGPLSLFVASTVALVVLSGRFGGAVTGAFAGATAAAMVSQRMLSGIDRDLAASIFAGFAQSTLWIQAAWVLVPVGAAVGHFVRRSAVNAELSNRAQRLRDARRQAWLDAQEEREPPADEESDAPIEPAESVHPQEPEPEPGPPMAVAVPTAEAPPPDAAASHEDEVDDIEITLFSTPMFAGLEPDDLTVLANLLYIEHVPAGRMLFEEDELQESLFIIRKGSLSIRKSVYGSEESTEITRMYPGAVLGEMAVVESQPRSATAVALEEVEVIRVEASVLNDLYERSPVGGVRILEHLIATVSERLQSSSHALFGEVKAREPGDPKGGLQMGENSELSRQEAQTLLTSLPLFRNMGPEDFHAMAPSLGKVRFEDGAFIAAKGDIEACMYLVIAGTAEVWLPNNAGERVVFARVGMGSSIGEMALFQDSPRSANVTAKGEVNTVVISRTALQRLAEGRPSVATKLYAALLGLLCQRLRRTSAQMADRAALTPEPASPPKAPDHPPDANLTEPEPTFEASIDEINPLARLTDDPGQWRLRLSAASPIVLSAALCWACTPGWTQALSTIPQPQVAVAVTRLNPGPMSAQLPVEPYDAQSGRLALESIGSGRVFQTSNWPCLPDTIQGSERYGVFPRRTATFALEATREVGDLQSLVETLRSGGVFRAALIGRAEGLQTWEERVAGWPVVSFLLDRPPRGAHWLSLSDSGTQTLGLLPGTAKPSSCALLVEDNVTVSALQHAVQQLQSPKAIPNCQGTVTLVLSTDVKGTERHPGWRGCQ